MIIKGKAIFTCPKTGKEVSLSKDCVECECFQHWMWEDAHPLLACNPDTKNMEQGGENVKLEEEKDKEEEGEEEEEEEEFE